MERFWLRWLLAASWLTAACGLLLTLATGTSILAPIEGPLLRSILGDGSVSPGVRTLHQWTFGVMGAVMFAWGVFALFIVRHGFARGEAWAWRCLSLGFSLWFVLDSTRSAIHGVWINVAANTGFLLLFAVPLVATAPRFLEHRSG
jgi:hypothetical protein